MSESFDALLRKAFSENNIGQLNKIRDSLLVDHVDNGLLGVVGSVEPESVIKFLDTKIVSLQTQQSNKINRYIAFATIASVAIQFLGLLLKK